MSGRWNPNGPNVAGDEWYGCASLTKPIRLNIGRGPTIVARASQSVDMIRALVRRSSGSGPVAVGVDVYDLANPVVDAQVLAMAAPVSNYSNAAGWVKTTSGVNTTYAADAYQNIDDTIADQTNIAFGYNDSLRYTLANPSLVAQILFHAGNSFWNGDTGAGGLSITGRRISSVDVLCVVRNDTIHSVLFDGYITIGGLRFSSNSGPQAIPGTTAVQGNLTRCKFNFWWNPATGLPWTNADAVALTNGTDSFGVGVITKSGAGEFVVTQAALQFQNYPERRVAAGYGTVPGSEGWVDLALLNPATGAVASWAKVNGNQYLILFSLTSSASPTEVLQVDTSTVFGLPAQALTDAAVRGYSLDHGAVPLSLDATAEGQIAALLMVGAAVSTDSLPYGECLDLPVQNGGSVRQNISTHSSQNYGSATVLVGRGSGGQTAGLAVTLKQTSNNAVLAGPVTIPVADVPADGKNHIVRVIFPTPVSLSSGTPVYIEATSASTVPWTVPVLQSRLTAMSPAETVSLAAAAAGIGGTADRAGVDTTRDFPWSIMVSPPAPTGLAAAIAQIPNRPALAYSGIGILETLASEINYAHVTWNATGLGGGFGYYELQRSDDSGTTWNTVRIGRAEASNSFDDIEGPRGRVADPVTRFYRVRVINSDGGSSLWSSSASVVLSVGHCADVVCSSNYDLAAALAFRDMTLPHQWDQLQTARGKMKPILGRDLPVAFWPAEQGGEAFTRKLAVAMNDPNVAVGGSLTPDRAIFDPAVDLLQDRTLPYICYADAYGRVWLTSPAIVAPGPIREEPGGRYSLTVLFTEVESDPVPVDS